MSAFETPNWTKSIFIIQTLGILLAPTLFAASVYMVLGRIILLTEGEALSFVRRTWLTKIFVAGDVVSFLVQALGVYKISLRLQRGPHPTNIRTGGTMIVSGEPDKVSKGQTIILIGLFIQIVFFGLFMTNSFVFMLRLRSHPTSRSQNVPWMKHLCSLFFVSGLILIRSIYRVIEYTQGSGGTLMTHEVYLYVLDTALMFLVMVAFVIIHPSEITAHYQGGKVAFFFSSYEVLKGYDGRTQGSVDLLPLNHGNVRV
jgi:hypothetical protein